MKELFAAMAQAFPEIEGATKDSNNPHFKSKYADLSSVVEAIKPALIKHGLFFYQSTRDADGGVCISTYVGHKSGESMDFGALFVPASKQDAQGYGSALTYARRYSLMTAFGVCPEDDDGNAASKPRPDVNADRITEKQVMELETIAADVGANIKLFCEHFKIGALEDIRAVDFEKARNALQAKKKKAA